MIEETAGKVLKTEGNKLIGNSLYEKVGLLVKEKKSMEFKSSKISFSNTKETMMERLLIL